MQQKNLSYNHQNKLISITERYGVSLLSKITLDADTLAEYYCDDNNYYDCYILASFSGKFWDNIEKSYWHHKNPIDDYCYDMLTDIKEKTQALTFFHPQQKPYIPLQKWALQTGDVFQSPIKILVHPVYGLWFGLRGVLVFSSHATEHHMPKKCVVTSESKSPCNQCIEQPCLSGCPIYAFRDSQYHVSECRNYINHHHYCDNGCNARIACPINNGQNYPNTIKQYLMQNFK